MKNLLQADSVDGHRRAESVDGQMAGRQYGCTSPDGRMAFWLALKMALINSVNSFPCQVLFPKLSLLLDLLCMLAQQTNEC